MDRKYLENIIESGNTLCKFCENDQCEWCQVTRLVGDAQDEIDKLDENEEDRYIRSSTCRDYGPSNPWDAPGMSVKDFI